MPPYTPHDGWLNPADWKFCRVRDEKAREIADWHEHGSGAFGCQHVWPFGKAPPFGESWGFRRFRL
jgi:hypothetical protein